MQSQTSNPVWNQSFELDEIAGGEYLKIKCFNAERFGDDNIGSARVSLEGIAEGASRDVWAPLEKVSSGEIRLKVDFIKNEDTDAKVCSLILQAKVLDILRCKIGSSHLCSFSYK